MFATFVLERPVVSLANLPQALQGWSWVFGGLFMIFLLIWGLVVLIRWNLGRGTSLLYGLSGQFANTGPEEAWKPRTFWLAIAVSGLGLLVMGLCFAYGNAVEDLARWTPYALYSLTVACVAAIIAVGWEFLLDLFKLSGRRIWALARFSIKEAIRRKTLWTFCVILIVFLFASWFMQIADNPQDQWRTYVDLVFFVTSALILVTASVLACFSLPTDIKQQTLHTIVTKPVQRFEIVLGRILGFSLLMTGVLFVMSHLSLIYVLRVTDDAARSTTVRARVPIFGNLQFEELDMTGAWNRRGGGENVGREWEYRQHLRGGSTQEAVWKFNGLSSSLAQRDRVPVEFTFDIFRTNKGGDDYTGGVACQFKVVNTSKWDYANLTAYKEAKDPETGLPMSDQERSRKFGYYELPAPKDVFDYETMAIEFPGSVMEGLGDGTLEIRVNCRSHGQYLGVAPPDLYVLADEGNFYLNFLKGTLGIWFLSVLLITLGVVFSTYLSAMVGLMSTWLFMICGLPRLREYIMGLSMPTDTAWNPGGGPAEATLRLFRSENMVSPLEKTTPIWLIEQVDWGFRGFFWAFLRILPDLGQYERTMWVSEGFNIPGTDLLASFILLLVYVFPFLLAGYYLLKLREVAQ